MAYVMSRHSGVSYIGSHCLCGTVTDYVAQFFFLTFRTHHVVLQLLFSSLSLSLHLFFFFCVTVDEILLYAFDGVEFESGINSHLFCYFADVFRSPVYLSEHPACRELLAESLHVFIRTLVTRLEPQLDALTDSAERRFFFLLSIPRSLYVCLCSYFSVLVSILVMMMSKRPLM